MARQGAGGRWLRRLWGTNGRCDLRRRRWLLLTGMGALVLVLALVAAGCGGGGGGGNKSSGGTSTGQASGGTASQNEGRTFPLLRVTWDAPDYFDPGLSYTVTGWQIMQHVYLGLVGYKWTAGPAGATVVPALAQSLPQVSADGKDYKF